MKGLRLDDEDLERLEREGRIRPDKKKAPRDAQEPTSLQRMQAIGRVKDDPLNKTERAWATMLDLADDVPWYTPKPFNLRLADNTYYRPDFLVMRDDLTLEIHEVKGWWTDDALVKIKVAAEQFPIFKFIAVSYKKKQWEKREF
jgi:hypothetical protein